MNLTYHYGKGRVEVAEIGLDGGLLPWMWLMDVSELTLSFEESTWAHRESFSGQDVEVRDFSEGVTASGSLTLQSLSTSNLAIFSRGSLTEKPASTVTGESLGTVTASSVLQLANGGVSDVVIIDSTGTPATIASSHYSYDEWGEVKFSSLPNNPAPTMPLKAAYSHLSSTQVALLTGQKKNFALRYKGVNKAEASKKCLAQLFKVSPGLLQSLGLISSGQQVASAPVSFKILADTSKPANSGTGQFGIFETYGY